MKTTIFIITAFLFTLHCQAQSRETTSNSYLLAGFKQIKESANFRQLVLDSGTWKGNQLVSKKWIEEMTKVRINDMYSKQFSDLWCKDESRKRTCMHGHVGHFIGIIPDKNLVVVFTAEVNTQEHFQLGTEALDWVNKIVEICE